jgi:hypothetical protein
MTTKIVEAKKKMIAIFNQRKILVRRVFMRNGLMQKCLISLAIAIAESNKPKALSLLLLALSLTQHFRK